ncbi:hypothetical protein EJB05_13077, partial [Eragrostis curvula]
MGKRDGNLWRGGEHRGTNKQSGRSGIDAVAADGVAPNPGDPGYPLVLHFSPSCVALVLMTEFAQVELFEVLKDDKCLPEYQVQAIG